MDLHIYYPFRNDWDSAQHGKWTMLKQFDDALIHNVYWKDRLDKDYAGLGPTQLPPSLPTPDVGDVVKLSIMIPIDITDPNSGVNRRDETGTYSTYATFNCQFLGWEWEYDKRIDPNFDEYERASKYRGSYMRFTKKDVFFCVQRSAVDFLSIIIKKVPLPDESKVPWEGEEQ